MTRVDKFHRRLIPAVLISLCLTFPIDEAGAAHTTTSFADVEPGPRILAMGGAGTALALDPTAAWWNPAGLYFIRGTRAIITYDDLYDAGLAQRSYLSVAWKKVHYEPKFEENRMTLEKDLGRGSAWGLSVSSIFLDLGEDSYSELMPTVSFAAGLGGGVGIGSSVSFLKASSGVEGVGSSGYTASFGAGVNLPAGAHLGLVARNLLSSVSPEGGSREKLPVTSGVGLSIPIGTNALVAADATFSDGDDGPSRLSAGGEYWFLQHHLAGRAGLRHFGGSVESRTVPTFGIGIEWKRLNFDYALTADGSEGPGATHRFGLNILLGRPQ
ncbi:MAG: hypothetical protein SGI90_15555 [Candidatus Eisenbacteria bacterium]|nr:hypothetical protein [Candidatus Eisenbacteria bacterium]